jgi:hypothetical protein
VLLTLALAEWRGLINNTSIIGVHWDFNYPFYRYQELQIAKAVLNVYVQSQYNLNSILFNAPVNLLLFGVLGGLPVPVAAEESALLVCVSFLTGASVFITVGKLVDDRLSVRLPASVLYMFNPWVFYQTVEGHIGVLVSYAVMPLVFLEAYRYWRGERVMDRRLLVLLFLLLVLQFQSYFLFFYLFFLIVFLVDDALFDRHSLWRDAQKFLLSLALLAALDSYVILNEFYTVLLPGAASALPSVFTLWLGPLPLYYLFLWYIGNGSFNQAIAGYELVWIAFTGLLFGISLLAVTFARERLARVAYLLLLLGYGLPILFSTPVGKWIFPRLPILVFFHNTGDYLFLSALALPLLLSVVLSRARDGLGMPGRRAAGVALIALVVTSLAIYSYPSLATGDFHHNVSTFKVPDSYLKAEEFVEARGGGYANAWLPLFPAQDSPHYLTGGTAYNPMQTYSDDTFDWLGQPLGYYLDSALAYGEADVASPLLGLFSVKYILAPADMWVPDLSPLDARDVTNYPGLLDNSTLYSAVYRSPNVTVFENSFVLPPAFSMSGLPLFVGNMEELAAFELNYSRASGAPLMVSFPFSERGPVVLSNLGEASWLIAGDNYTDYLVAELLSNYTYFAPEGLKGASGWEAGLPPYLPPSLSASPYPFTYSTGPATARVPIPANESGDLRVLAYIYESPEGSWMSFGLGPSSVNVSTVSPVAGWRWVSFDVHGSTDGGVLVRAGDGLNGLAVVCAAPQGIYASALGAVDKALEGKPVIDAEGATAAQLRALAAAVNLEPLKASETSTDSFSITIPPGNSSVIFLTSVGGPGWVGVAGGRHLMEVNGLGVLDGFLIPRASTARTIHIYLPAQAPYEYLTLACFAAWLSLPVVYVALSVRRRDGN